MSFFNNAFGMSRKSKRKQVISKSHAIVEDLEERVVLSAQPLPVLMVIADRQDFYYQEYNDTRQGIENQGVQVQVAAASTAPSTPHPGTGQPTGTTGTVVPDIALADVDASDYSAIVFVGGWGSSAYQYGFQGTYANSAYNGDVATKQVVNDLVNEFLTEDKEVAAICHGVTVLAWARVDGVSPLAGKHVSVPYIGSPAVDYQGMHYENYQLGQYEQVVANGAIANLTSGQYGNPATATDDVVVDGRIITGENYDSALQFGKIVAQEVKAALDEAVPPPVNHAPVADDEMMSVDENAPFGYVVGVVSATDPDAGQHLTYAIVGGNVGNAFEIDSATGEISVANSAALDFETQSEFQLLVQVSDDGAPSLNDTSLVTIDLRDLAEGPPAGVLVVGKDLIVQGSSGADVIYVWSGERANEVFVWMNQVQYGPYRVAAGPHVRIFAGAGDDQVYATDLRVSAEIHGEEGHDLITGGSADDILDGGDGVDRLSGNDGNDMIFGGLGDDFVYGGRGNDVLLGGAGNDYLDGDIGRDVLIGGEGRDYAKGGSGDDLLIGGTTSYDNDRDAMATIRSIWVGADSISSRLRKLSGANRSGIQLAWGRTVQDDGAADTLCGGDNADLVFSALGDELNLGLGDILMAK